MPLLPEIQPWPSVTWSSLPWGLDSSPDRPEYKGFLAASALVGCPSPCPGLQRRFLTFPLCLPNHFLGDSTASVARLQGFWSQGTCLFPIGISFWSGAPTHSAGSIQERRVPVCTGEDCDVGRGLSYTWVHILPLKNLGCMICKTMVSTASTSQDGCGN